MPPDRLSPISSQRVFVDPSIAVLTRVYNNEPTDTAVQKLSPTPPQRLIHPDNPAYFNQIQRKFTSYWTCYWRYVNGYR